MEVTHLLVLLLYTIMDVFLRDEYVLRPAAPIALSSGTAQDPVKAFADSLPFSEQSATFSSSTSEVYALMISARSPTCARGDGPSNSVQTVGSFPFPAKQAPRPAQFRAKTKQDEPAPPNDPSSGLLHSVNNALLGLKVLYEAHEAARRQGIFRLVQQIVARSFGSHKLTLASIKC